MSDEMVSHPQHYNRAKTALPDGTAKYEPIKVWDAWGWGYGSCMGSALKYVLRAGHKDPGKTLEDLKKAVFYLDRAAGIVETLSQFTIDKMRELQPPSTTSAREVASDWGLPTYLYGAVEAMEQDNPKAAAHCVRMHITERFGEELKNGG